MRRITYYGNILIFHCSYYKKTYPDKVVFKYIMYEFLINFIGKDIRYLNINELQEHLNDFFYRDQD